MSDFFKNVGRVELEVNDSSRSLSFESHGAEYLGKKILSGEFCLDSLLKPIADDEIALLK